MIGIAPPESRKAPTGIEGFDEMTGGGLPEGRTTLLVGGPGSGKTVMALQTLVNGARMYGEPGIFVAFEESAEWITKNAAGFGWDLPNLPDTQLLFIDAQPTAELLQSGNFDLLGLLAGIESKVVAMGARRIVFDSVDVLLQLLNNPSVERREAYRLHEWLLRHGLTSVITAKAFGDRTAAPDQHVLGFLQFLVDCAVVADRRQVDGVSQRSLRIIKYRGSTHSENDSPFIIGARGLDVAGTRRRTVPATHVSNERVSLGIERLDGLLCGGVFRGSTVLVTGSPGTAKSTLAAAFTAAACRRGEPTVFISFDSPVAEVLRNFTSVNIHLSEFVDQGVLHMEADSGASGSAETHLLRIKALARDHGARNLVIDPLSALSKLGNEITALGVAERLVDWCKSEGITLFGTSLLSSPSPDQEGTSLQVSTIADTWIHLSNITWAGERNRALTIVKSRGTAHSNQVRELVLSDDGVTLADVYTAGGDVLMGTQRWERERAELETHRERTNDIARRRAVLEAELASLVRAEHDLQTASTAFSAALGERRGADVSPDRGHS